MVSSPKDWAARPCIGYQDRPGGCQVSQRSVQYIALLQVVEQQAAEDDQLRITVGHRIDKSPKVGGFAAQPRHRPIQRIHRSHGEDEQPADGHLPGRQEISPDRVADQPNDGHGIGHQAQPVEKAADRVEHAL